MTVSFPYNNSLLQFTGQTEKTTQQIMPSEETDSQRAVKAFKDYMEKTPEERYFEAILREKGYTPEQLATLSPERRAEVIEEVQAEIEKRTAQKIEEQTQKQS